MPGLLSVRRLSGLIAAAWVAIGLVGLYSYLDNYYETRGFAAVRREPGVVPGRLFWPHFFSPALGRVADYLIYLPTGYDPSRRYPVFYLLHGMPGRPQAYIRIASLDARLDNLIRSGQTPPMILVFPDGRINGDAQSDSEWANTSAGRYEDYVLDVVHNVDQRFATIANRDARVIGGLSAGATGALNVALHHLADFASLEAWSGPFAETRSGVFAHATNAQIAYYSPLAYAPRLGAELARFPLQAFLYGGRSDFDSRKLPQMAAELRAAGARVQWTFYRGGHDWELWNAHVNQMLILAGRFVLHPPHSRRTLASIRRHGRHHEHHRRRRRKRSRHAASAPITPTTRAAGGRVAPGGAATQRLTLGLLLALASAVAINIGFLLQHRGLAAAARRPSEILEQLQSAFRTPTWIAGQAIGWTGFGGQIAAVAIAPLSVVQAFAAGGLALSVPLAARLFKHRISKPQATAVILVAVGLACLPIALPHARDHLRTSGLLIATAVAALFAVELARTGGTARRAIAAGVFYGIADAAIKAVSLRWAHLGAGALLSGWTALASLGTFAGFVSFQASLRGSAPVSSISLMNISVTLVALGCGLLAFGESLGAEPVSIAGHALALLVVLACIPVLAAAHMGIADEVADAAIDPAHVIAEPAPAAAEPGRPAAAKATAAGEQQRFEIRPGTRRSMPQHLPEV
jgi:enterochelin esterase-like enzyme